MKNKLNYEILEFHIREAAGELDSLLRRIQFMLGRLDKAHGVFKSPSTSVHVQPNITLKNSRPVSPRVRKRMP